MKIPKNYFENLSAQKYKEYLKLLPDFKNDHTKLITTLIFTFAAMSFFGIFAINPTVSTIVELKKQLADSGFVHQQLTAKIKNLSTLQEQYASIESELPIVYGAIPQSPQAALLSGQIEALAQEMHITITSFRVFEVQLASTKPPPPNGSSFTFFLEGRGDYEDMIAFSSSLARLNRIITVESMSVAKDPKQESLQLTIRGREYFKK